MPDRLRFRNPRQLEDHFLNHRVEFDPVPASEIEYEDRASEFALPAASDTIREAVRPFDKATIRWDRSTNEFVIVTADGFLATYMILDPRWHGFASNRAYFEWQQRRRS